MNVCRCRFFSVGVVLLGLAWGAAPVQAQFASDTVTFTAAEEKVISANEALVAARKADPWLVRHLFTKVPELAEPSATTKDMPVNRAGSLQSLSPEESDFLRRNPAMDKLFRTSPEAAHDLLVLIRNAAKQGSAQNQ